MDERRSEKHPEPWPAWPTTVVCGRDEVVARNAAAIGWYFFRLGAFECCYSWLPFAISRDPPVQESSMSPRPFFNFMNLALSPEIFISSVSTRSAALPASTLGW